MKGIAGIKVTQYVLLGFEISDSETPERYAIETGRSMYPKAETVEFVEWYRWNRDNFVLQPPAPSETK